MRNSRICLMRSLRSLLEWSTLCLVSLAFSKAAWALCLASWALVLASATLIRPSRQRKIRRKHWTLSGECEVIKGIASSDHALIMLVIAHNKVCLYLLKKLLHYSHSFIQLFFCMLGSIQGIIGHCNSSFAIQTTTVTFAFIITTTSTATRTVHTWSVTRCSTYLQKQYNNILY